MDEKTKKALADAVRPLLSKVRTDARVVKAPGKAPYKQDKLITEMDLLHHVNGGPGLVVYFVRPGTSSTDALAFDLDDHTKVMPWAVKVETAIAISDELARRGIRSRIVRSGGGHGLHVWALFATPQDARSVRALGRSVLAAIGYTDGTGGLEAKQIEVYPKQDSVALGAYGGGLALPFAYQSVLIDELTGDPMPKEAAIGLEWFENADGLVPYVEPAPVVPVAAIGDVDLDVLASALDAIPNDSSVGYDDWVKTIAAVHGSAPGDDGRALAYDWSVKSSKHTDAEFEKRWSKFMDPTTMSKRATAGSIFHKARGLGWADPVTVAALAALDEIDVLAALDEIPGSAFPVGPVGPGPSDLPFFRRNPRTGVPFAYLSNVTAALENPYTSGGVVFGFDEFLGEIMVAQRPGQWRRVADVDLIRIRQRFETMEDGIPGIGKETMRDAVDLVADDARFDSAKTWIGGLVWDGVPRVHRLMSTYYGAADTPYTRAVACYLMTALAGRALVPGIKADMMVILVGGQGKKKTEGVAALSPDREFFGEISLDGKPDDLARAMMGKLVLELSELRGLQSRDVEHTKAFLSRRIDEWVPKYRERTLRYFRRGVIIGTTNADTFLEDATGNRRMLPVRISDEGGDVEAIRRDCAQLWAEGAAMFNFDRDLGGDGVMWQDAENLARAEHADYEVVDLWEAHVADWLANRETPDALFKAVHAVQGALSLPVGSLNSGHMRRVASVLKKLGYCEVRRYVDGVQSRFWVKKDAPTGIGPESVLHPTRGNPHKHSL